MPTTTDFKVIKEKQIDEYTTLTVSKNIMSGRIFVEFISKDPKVTLQKSFQDNLDGKSKSKKFAKSIKNSNELREYFGLKKKQ